MARQLTVRRVGGMLPTMRPSKTWALDELEPHVRHAAQAFMAAAGRARGAPHAEAMSYVFELDGRTVSVPFADIPAELHALLPGPGPR